MPYYGILSIILVILLAYVVRKTANLEQFQMGTYANYQSTVEIPHENIKAYIAIIRHGTRYPTKKVYKHLDPAIQNVIPTDQLGNLTTQGYQEMLDYGKELVAKYPQIFNQPERFLVFSTSVYRARQSAQACLQGIGTKAQFNYGPAIDSVLKINNYFKKERPDPDTVSCQFAKILGLNQQGCIQENISLYEQRRNGLTVQSMEEGYYKAFPLYNILLDLIRLCIVEKWPRGYLFFAHDSTLSPLYYLFGLIDKMNYSNDEWLPFGARLEILITRDHCVQLYVNGQFKKKFSPSSV